MSARYVSEATRYEYRLVMVENSEHDETHGLQIGEIYRDLGDLNLDRASLDRGTPSRIEVREVGSWVELTPAHEAFPWGGLR